MNISGSPTDREQVTFSVSVQDPESDGAEFNPGESGSVILDSRESVSFFGAQDVTLTFDNTGDSGLSITEARVSFFFNGESGAGPGFSSDKPSEVEIFSIGQDVQSGEATTLTIGGSFETLSEPIPLNPTESDSSTMTDIDLSFDENVGSEDFYVLTLRLSNGETYTYFVSHP